MFLNLAETKTVLLNLITTHRCQGFQGERHRNWHWSKTSLEKPCGSQHLTNECLYLVREKLASTLEPSTAYSRPEDRQTTTGPLSSRKIQRLQEFSSSCGFYCRKGFSAARSFTRNGSSTTAPAKYATKLMKHRNIYSANANWAMNSGNASTYPQ